MSQAAATLCIQVPTLEAKAAIHSALKRGTRSGAHAEEEAAACVLVTRGLQRVPSRSRTLLLGAIRLKDYLDVTILSLIKLLVGLFYLLK